MRLLLRPLLLLSLDTGCWVQQLLEAGEHAQTHSTLLSVSSAHKTKFLKQRAVGTVHAGNGCAGYSAWFAEDEYCAAACCRRYDWKLATNSFLLPRSRRQCPSASLGLSTAGINAAPSNPARSPARQSSAIAPAQPPRGDSVTTEDERCTDKGRLQHFVLLGPIFLIFLRRSLRHVTSS